MQRICSLTGVLVARNVLGLRKGSFLSRYSQLFVAFAVSGAVHAGASILVHGAFEDDGAMRAFLFQAVVIMVEDHVVMLGKRWGCRDCVGWRVVGFVWTGVAYGVTCERWICSMIERGIWVHDREKDWFGIGPEVKI